MAAYLTYGTHTHDSGEVSVAIDRATQVENGICRSYIETWQINGRLHADTQAALLTKITTLESAYSTHGKDLTFVVDAGNAHRLLSSNCIGGTRIIQRPTYLWSDRAQLSTYRNYTITVEGEVLDTTIGLVHWKERIQRMGGGPEFIHHEPIEGQPQKQQVKQATVYRAIQSGEAIGLLAYPIAPFPRWPDAFKQQLSNVSEEGPDRVGPPGYAQYKNYRISWSYFHESAYPLIGLPAIWPV